LWEEAHQLFGACWLPACYDRFTRWFHSVSRPVCVDLPGLPAAGKRSRMDG
jgi:hypothetical protein